MCTSPSPPDGLPAGQGSRPHPLDAIAQMWMVTTSRRLPASTCPWVLGPCGDGNAVGHEWVDRAAASISGSTSTGAGHGLIPDFTVLAGATCNPALVDPRIVDFYQHTASWALDLWSEWSALAWPFGRLVTALWSERLQQLSLPMRPLDVSLGMNSSVVHIHGADGEVTGAAWLRTLRRTGTTTYSGYYGTVTLPGSRQPSVRVVFPLPYGCLTVLLQPAHDGQGGLFLRSPLGRFGTEGAYLVLLRPGDQINVRRIPIAETFHLYVDRDGDVRADHGLSLGRLPAMRLHYRLRRDAARPGGDV